MIRFTRILTLSLCAVALTIALAAQSGWAGPVAYLTVHGSIQGVIQGDSIAQAAPHGILVQAIGLGLTIPTTGVAIGTPVVAPFKIAKFPDKASPKLLLAALTSEVLRLDLTWFGQDLPGPPYSRTFSITLENAFITSIETAGATTVVNGVTEEVSFAFTKITFRDERVSPAIVTCWDVAGNRRC